MAGAWLLLEKNSGIVIAVGARRLPAIGLTDNYSTQAEMATIYEALQEVTAIVHRGEIVQPHTDSYGSTQNWTAPERNTQRRMNRKPDSWTTLRTRATAKALEETHGIWIATPEWQPAGHNLIEGDDRASSVDACANCAVDILANKAAEKGREKELDFYRSHEPPPGEGGAYFSAVGAPIMGDPSKYIKSAAARRTAGRAAKSDACGLSIQMARRGEIHLPATAAARRFMKTFAVGAAVRAALGRIRGAPTELLRTRETC